MKISISSGCFADPAAELLCRSRLAAALARYSDLVSALAVRPSAVGLRVELELGSGVALAVEQAEVVGPHAIIHLADRVGRAVARRIELAGEPGLSGLLKSSKISKPV